MKGSHAFLGETVRENSFGGLKKIVGTRRSGAFKTIKREQASKE